MKSGRISGLFAWIDWESSVDWFGVEFGRVVGGRGNRPKKHQGYSLAKSTEIGSFLKRLAFGVESTDFGSVRVDRLTLESRLVRRRALSKYRGSRKSSEKTPRL